MNQSICRYVSTCDVCQNVKHRRQVSPGLLQLLPIFSDPFEVVTMDFITELPESNQFNAILVIVDKLTKYGHFIPTHTNVTAKETATLVFQHIIAHYGLPRQFIRDRDCLWSGVFWQEICRHLQLKHSLSTAYHPQMDGQTENLNQTLEIAL